MTYSVLDASVSARFSVFCRTSWRRFGAAPRRDVPLLSSGLRQVSQAVLVELAIAVVLLAATPHSGLAQALKDAHTIHEGASSRMNVTLSSGKFNQQICGASGADVSIGIVWRNVTSSSAGVKTIFITNPNAFDIGILGLKIEGSKSGNCPPIVVPKNATICLESSVDAAYNDVLDDHTFLCTPTEEGATVVDVHPKLWDYDIKKPVEFTRIDGTPATAITLRFGKWPEILASVGDIFSDPELGVTLADAVLNWLDLHPVPNTGSPSCSSDHVIWVQVEKRASTSKTPTPTRTPTPTGTSPGGNLTPSKTPTPTISPTATPTNRPPIIQSWQPVDGSVVANNTPRLSVVASDPDGDALKYNFRLIGEGVDVSSNWIAASQWQVPAHTLDPATTYGWFVQVWDSKNPATISPALSFRVQFMPVAAEIVATPDGQGYWTVDSEGRVTAFNAVHYGHLKDSVAVQNIIGMARTADGGGYWLVGSDGGVFAFGNAVFYGSMGGQALNSQVVAMSPTADGGGYWLVAGDGGVFAFGNAAFYGSTGGTALNAPVVGMAPTPDSAGYWLVAKDGGIFTFGNAQFYGSMGGQPLNAPITDIAVHPSGTGYWMVAEDGGVFAFGGAPFHGSLAGAALGGRIVAMERTPDGDGYWLLGCDGGVFTFGNAPFLGSNPIYACRGVVGEPRLPARYALRVASGHIVSAEGGGGSLIIANRTAIGPWESFTNVAGVGGRTAIRTITGHYACAEGGGGLNHYVAFNATRVSPGDWESFKVEFIDGKHIALRTSTGHYVTAHLGGGAVLVTNRTARGPWETFEVIPLLAPPSDRLADPIHYADGKLLWRYRDGRISLWTIDGQGNRLSSKENGPFGGWTAVDSADDKLLWRRDDGRISLWTVDSQGNQISYKEHGPFAGWTAINYSDGKLLWRHNDGRISLWTVDSQGNQISYRDHGPFPGWTAINYSDGKLLWRHNDGRVSLWSVDSQGNRVSYMEHGPFGGWTAINYADGKLLWRHDDGRISLWTVDNQGNRLGYKEHGPFARWTAVNYADAKLLWRRNDGAISLWTVDGQGNQISYREYGPIP